MRSSTQGGPGAGAHHDAPLVPAFLWPWSGLIIVSLTMVCGVFGVLTAGEVGAWPSEQRVADRVRTDVVPDRVWDLGLLLGDAWFFALVVLALGIWAVARRSWPALIACAAVPGAVVVVELFLKPIVDRRYAWYLPSTYPSGTAAGVAAWTTLAWLLAVPLLSPRRRLILALVLGAMTSFTAVAIVAAEKHLPLDAVGGVALGIAVVLASTAVIDLITHAHRRNE
jgi:membrane-associated phospholipid phosphatase